MDDENNYTDVLSRHYDAVWGQGSTSLIWEYGPVDKLNDDFSVQEFPPGDRIGMWVYATSGMSSHMAKEGEPVELHMFSCRQDRGLAELLTSVAYYHKLVAKLNLHHTVNFGQPWQDNSRCDHGFISLPYINGPALMDCAYLGGNIKCYWMIPVTENEVAFKIKYGAEALEAIFDREALDYPDPGRNDVTR